MAKPLSGGVFNPMGVVRKEKTPGFNYPPMRFSKFANAGSTMFYKTDGFNNQTNRGMQRSLPPNNIRKSQVTVQEKYKDMSIDSDNSSISNK